MTAGADCITTCGPPVSASWSPESVPSLTGLTALVTGANSGLGLACATALAGHGARVFLGCRDRGRGTAALGHVRAAATEAEPELVLLDLLDRASLTGAATDLGGRIGSLDVLVNNAGFVGASSLTPQGDDVHFACNHLGPFYLTGRLLPLLLRAKRPRVVSISSVGHWIGRPTWHAGRGHDAARRSGLLGYMDSKLAILVFAAELDRRAKRGGFPLESVAAHPGLSDSNLGQEGKERLAWKVMSPLMDRVLQPVGVGVGSHLRAATDQSLLGGEYIGPSGPFGIVGPPSSARRRRLCSDPNAGRALWELSERRCDFSYPWPARMDRERPAAGPAKPI